MQLRDMNRILRKVFGGVDEIAELRKRGLTIGTNCNIQWGCLFDPPHCWLISIGDRVTIAPKVTFIAHDASTKRILGYTRIGRITVEDDVFIGINTTVLLGVKIGKGAIIGAGSVVTHDVPSGMVACGNPARVICSTEEYIEKKKRDLRDLPIFDYSYTLKGGITDDMKQEMQRMLRVSNGFVE